MRFVNERDEENFREQVWNDNKGIFRGFSIVVFLHTIYVTFVNYISNIVWTYLTYGFLYGIYYPVPILMIIFSFCHPYRKRSTRVLWNTLLAIAGVMLAFAIVLRSLLCYYNLEEPTACTAENRPVSAANYSIIYILLGPFLMLTVMRVSPFYQIIGIFATFVLIVILVILISVPNVVTYLGFIFILGSQVMGIIIAHNREKVERKRYISDMRNVILGENLKIEVNERTKAQKKAKDEEDLRTRFTSILFHEMRVPLNNIVLTVDDLEADEAIQDTEAKDNISIIKQGLTSITNILNDSLDIRKAEEGKMEIKLEPFEYNAMLKNLCRSMESGWKSKGIHFTMDLDDRLYQLRFQLLGDQGRLRQVVANFLSNATKFTPPNGEITLSTKVEHEDDNTVTVYTAVTDTGIGINSENQDKLFKPFVQIDPQKNQAGKGTGLGLYICALMIRSMGGTYGIISREGQGSTFWFRLQFVITNVIKGSVPIDIPNAISTDPLHFKPLRILVTDDDATTRRILSRNLERSGHHMIEAFDGQDCIEKVQKSIETNDPIDIVFIDNQMPRMNGLEAITEMRRRGYTVPIICVTGSSDVDEMQELQQAGATMVIVKPVKFDRIKEVLVEISKDSSEQSLANLPIVVQPHITPPPTKKRNGVA